LTSELPARPSLVGRDQEVEQLGQHLDSALNGKGTTVFICGEAGVGKTRLVSEFLNLARKRGAKVLEGWCLSEAAIPYFPFTEAFNSYMSTVSDEKVKSTMTKELGITGWLRGPESAPRSKTSDLLSTPEMERDRTFDAVARVFLQLAAKEPLILFLDDLHWADHLSLALLHYLSRKCRSSRLLIIGTYRPEEIIPAREERLHPLEETMFSMSREDLLIKMELNRLKRNDFPELLRSIFRSSMDHEFVERLYKETEGNPLFALEALNLLVDEGILAEKEGRWTLTAQTEKIGLPSKVHDVIVRRIGRLRRPEKKLLDLAAVCGYSFSPDTLCRISALDIADVFQTLVEIEKRHRLIRSADSTFEFTHHKIREVIYRNLPHELRRIYHLQTASCLEQVLAEKISDGYTADLAFHYVEGGAHGKAFEYLVKLGEKAVNIFANVQAIEYLDKALEATQKTPAIDTSENLAKIYGLRGKAWLGQGDFAKALHDFDLALQNATRIGDESTIAEAHYWVGSTLGWAAKRDETMLHLTKALETARRAGNKYVEGRSLSELAVPLYQSVDTLEEARGMLEESLRAGREIGDRVLEAHILRRLGLNYYWKGELDRAKENLNESLTLASELGNNFLVMGALLFLTMVHGGRGEYNEATSAAGRCLQISQDWGIVYYIPRVLNVLGWIYHDLANIELAFQHNNEALRTARTHQESIAVGAAQPACLVNLGMDYLYEHDYGNAEKSFNEASSLVHLHEWGKWRFETRILLGLGEISLAKGDYKKTLKLAEDSLAISEKAGAKKYIAKGLKLKAEALAEMGKFSEAVELMENALNSAQRVGNPPLLWQIHYSLGLLFEKRQNPQRANEHYAESVALIETTASKLNDPSLKNALSTAPLTKAARDAYARTKPTP
jgi:predicted ATPase